MDPRRSEGLGLPVVLAFALVAVFVLFNGVLAHHHTALVYENGRAVAEGHQRIEASDRLFSLMQDAETGQRDFLLTGKEAYLAPYELKADSEEGALARAIIQRQVQQMARMVDDLIDVARISSGRMVLRRAPTEIREVVEAAMETTAPLFEERRHALELNLARRIVDLHGGTIEASSPGAGRGSTFVVTLPVSGPPNQRPQAAPGGAASAHRILVVEDNEDVRRALETVLRLAGCTVVAAADGAQGLAEAPRFRPTVAFVDLGLPDMSGYEVARGIRGDPSLAGVHLVALTGWAQEGDRQHSVAAGFDHHLVKPVEPETILRLLASLPAGVSSA
jgi:CheY-like chemotaxis protein